MHNLLMRHLLQEQLETVIIKPGISYLNSAVGTLLKRL